MLLRTSSDMRRLGRRGWSSGGISDPRRLGGPDPGWVDPLRLFAGESFNISIFGVSFFVRQSLSGSLLCVEINEINSFDFWLEGELELLVSNKFRCSSSFGCPPSAVLLQSNLWVKCCLAGANWPTHFPLSLFQEAAPITAAVSSLQTNLLPFLSSTYPLIKFVSKFHYLLISNQTEAETRF